MTRKTMIMSAAAAVMLSLAGCKKDSASNGPAAQLAGQWELTGAELATRSITIGQEEVAVYMDFRSDGSFRLYQQLGAGRFVPFEGSWTLSGDVLSGRYSDNVQWGSDYRISIDGDVLTMTVWPDDSDVYRYARCSIPEDVL